MNVRLRLTVKRNHCSLLHGTVLTLNAYPFTSRAFTLMEMNGLMELHRNAFEVKKMLPEVNESQGG